MLTAHGMQINLYTYLWIYIITYYEQRDMT